ncbi:hypothetical protein Xen7305DRAFT_00011140 [Xenococcus sp. PCC 7305]|uniref:hypothetical protein n=1 Tax=Xenococcus sp. PCC 7305 TaxID=102125 RepID=UPI0002ACA5D3|nr:hypothetical protein [Xenococcus sp. PCC 7305]ELS01410.1 hypothetical protein Xen7305DRAFT_00011140 [Xenococcus sp. PCC 7305]
MLRSRIRSLLVSPLPEKSDNRLWRWFYLSLLFAVYMAWAPLQKALSHEYLVQDDARQHIFWMQRFIDPELFPHDLLANYFQSVAPTGYSWLYQGFAGLGVDPILLHKLLPLPLMLLSTAYVFEICWQLLRVPFAGFLAAMLLNISLWMRDDVVSATPVAFAYPLLLAFVYYWLKRSLIPSLLAIALLGSFYPQSALVAGGLAVASLVDLSTKKLRNVHNYAQVGSVLGVLVLVLLPYLGRNSAFGPVVTASEARNLAAFSVHGWSHFFDPNPWYFWFCGKRSGMLPGEWCKILLKRDFWLFPPQIWFGLSLPLLMKFPQRLPLVRFVNSKINILWQWLLVSVIWFGISHALIFALHLPNRYTANSWRLIAAIAGAIALTIVLDGLIHCARIPRFSLFAKGLGIVMLLCLLIYPITLRNNFYLKTGYVIGEAPHIYEFLQEQPKDILIASLNREANNLPTFAQRSIFVGGEGYLLPYHQGYYQELKQRTAALIHAQYSTDWRTVTDFVEEYEIDFWLIGESAFTLDELAQNSWLHKYPTELAIAKETLSKGSVPILSNVFDRCTVVKNKTLRLLDTSCFSEPII